MPRSRNPGTVLSRLKKAEEGMKTEIPSSVKSMAIDGKVQPIGVVSDRLKEFIDVFEAPELLDRARKNAIQKRKTSHRSALDFLEELRCAVTPMMGATSVRLDSFGFPRRKRPRKLTAKQVATKTEKAKKTRELRHTMGKKQKQSIKAGNAAPPQPPPKGPSPK